MVLRTMKFSIRSMEKPRKNIVFCMHMHTKTYIFREPEPELIHSILLRNKIMAPIMNHAVAKSK